MRWWSLEKCSSVRGEGGVWGWEAWCFEEEEEDDEDEEKGE